MRSDQSLALRAAIPCAVVAVLVIVFALAGCSEGSSTGEGPAPAAASSDATGAPDDAATDEAAEQQFPDVVGVEISPDGGGTFSLDVTISSPYDSPERYADGWRVLDADGTVLGEHTLAHDHASEQPFTRTQSGVEIPDGVTEVTVEGRDQQYGFGGGTLTVDVPR
ncbi:hypothetical protein GCM10025865_18800 [Paraoerskovia sediminicola]|uniref:Uncharacterized protein n=1 Tax=Paraoerskovia sediminicola TaxID=1138587 RepID=A0ABN6XCH9_9CELL|nr:hypothetical protein [Paraoerskovia sediminicola]BDZ42581.1 hypothetical protein GCM10025865_18800 [Paraoerskovia sediminicola]